MLDRLLEQSREFDRQKTDYGPVPVDRFSWERKTADLLVPGPMGMVAPLKPTHWAFSQACNRLGRACFPGTQRVLPVEYLERLPDELRAADLNHWQRELSRLGGGRQWFVRGDEDRARAVLTHRYSRIDVTETLGKIVDAVRSKGGADGVKITRATVTPDLLHLTMLVKTFRTGPGEGDAYAVGAYFTTGETGNRKLGVFPLVQRTSCLNSLAFPGEGSYEHSHTGNRRLLRVTFLSRIFEAVQASEKVLERLIRADQEELPDFADAVGKIAKSNGWSEVVEHRILLGSEGHETLWGLVMGVSAAARQTEDPTERADMERAAGMVLVPRKRQRSLSELVRA